MEVRLRHPSKAKAPIVVTVLGMMVVLKPVTNVCVWLLTRALSLGV